MFWQKDTLTLAYRGNCVPCSLSGHGTISDARRERGVAWFCQKHEPGDGVPKSVQRPVVKAIILSFNFSYVDSLH